ncbi:MAG: hypothetical protein ACOX2G_11310 [Bacillota bacterium]|jgi:hypothetical protein
MFFGNRIRKRNNPVLFLVLVIGIIIASPACSPAKGSILILENPKGTGFTMDFKEWSSQNKCELSLDKNDVLQVDIDREGGEIALVISGKNGSEPYLGNNLKSIAFTVTMPEADRYEIRIIGKNATGKVTVKCE